MQFDLIIIEDENVLNYARPIIDEALQKINHQHNQLSHIVFNEDLSKQISDSNFQELQDKLDKFTGNLIICLDMQLYISHDESELRNIINRFETEYGIKEEELKVFTTENNKSIDGILVAEKAILNKNAGRILIIPFTKSSYFGRLYPIFQKLIRESNREKEVIYFRDTEGAWSDINTILNSATDKNEKEEKKQGIVKFLTNAIGEFLKKFQNPVEKLRKELIRGCQVGDLKNGHPNRIDQIPNDMVCYEKLVSIGNDVENFKALYYQEDSRKIDANSFCCILKYAGIQINWKNKPSKKFFLPTRPGMIFLICLVDFLQHMNKSEIVLDTLQKEKGEPEIIISLELNDPERFKHAIFTGGGDCIKIYRNLLGCKKNIIVESMSQEERHTINTDKWYPAPMENGKCGNSDIYKCLLNGRVEGNRLIISWISEKPL